jgi:type IV pilus assembly protein PilV
MGVDMNRTSLARRRQAGFTLIEVLVALLVFSIGLLGMIGLQARATQISIEAEDANRAALLANELGSVIWTQSSNVVAPAVLAAWQARVADPQGDGLPGGVGAVVVNGNRTEITVSWTPAGSPAGSAPRRYVTEVTLP